MTTKPVTVLGIYFPSHRSACRFWNIDTKTARDRLGYGWSVDDAYIIRPNPANSRVNNPKAAVKYPEYRKNPIVPYSAYFSRRNAGWGHDEAISWPLRGGKTPLPRKPKMASVLPIHFVDGVGYPTKAAAYAAWGTSSAVVHYRMRNGLCWQDAVKFPIKVRQPPWSHTTTAVVNGVKRTVQDHCLYYDITPGAVSQRVKRGMSVAQAITAPSIRKWQDGDFSLYLMVNAYTLMSYVGITRKPETRLLTHWRDRNNRLKKNNPIYSAFRQYGMSSFSFDVIDKFNTVDEMKEAERSKIAELDSMWPNGYNLTSGGEYMATHITGYNVLDQTFDCKQDALDHFGVTDNQRKWRSKNGWAEEEVWGVRKRTKLKQYKVFGEWFSSKVEVAEKYNIKYATLISRTSCLGMGIEEAVNLKPLPPQSRVRNSTDAFGSTWPSLTFLCKFFAIGDRTELVRNRMSKRKMSPENAIMDVVRKYNGKN